ncbi:SDR family NAD(P)-dependent oxidoreductase [Actinoplanes sp. NPDC023714]|uniref:SDR family NAD(P)-dependent oxidoreductase n=1 Tax=Actinoplanes sp. NPDC023714 TaxID=3154322 RepID=UPI0033F51B19
MRALIVGNSDGIGLALTRRLLGEGWQVTGVSRSPAPAAAGDAAEHHVVDVTSPEFARVLASLPGFDLAVYAAGVGDTLTSDLGVQTRAIEVNLLGAARMIEAVVPPMLAAGRGHVIGLSSMADGLISADAPGYAASKAGLTSYLLSLDAALRPRGVAVSAVRFGFVDTKMAKSPVTPFKISAEEAADVLLRCVRKRTALVSFPRRMAALTGAVGPALRLGARLRRG